MTFGLAAVNRSDCRASRLIAFVLAILPGRRWSETVNPARRLARTTLLRETEGP